jgi:hypothetical protein
MTKLGTRMNTKSRSTGMDRRSGFNVYGDTV